MPQKKFDIEAARQSGATDDQIMQYLSQRSPSFNVDGALKSGATKRDIIDYLSVNATAPTGAQPNVNEFGREIRPGSPAAAQQKLQAGGLGAQFANVQSGSSTTARPAPTVGEIIRRQNPAVDFAIKNAGAIGNVVKGGTIDLVNPFSSVNLETGSLQVPPMAKALAQLAFPSVFLQPQYSGGKLQPVVPELAKPFLPYNFSQGKPDAPQLVRPAIDVLQGGLALLTDKVPPPSDQDWEESQRAAGGLLGGTLLGEVATLPAVRNVAGRAIGGAESLMNKAAQGPIVLRNPESMIAKGISKAPDFTPHIERGLSELKAGSKVTGKIKDVPTAENAIKHQVTEIHNEIRSIVDPQKDIVVPGSRRLVAQKQLAAIPEDVRLNFPDKYANFVKDLQEKSNLPDYTIGQLDDLRSELGHTQSAFFGKDLQGQLTMDAGVRGIDIARGAGVRNAFYEALDKYGRGGGAKVRELNSRLGSTISWEDALRHKRGDSIIASGTPALGKLVSKFGERVRQVNPVGEKFLQETSADVNQSLKTAVSRHKGTPSASPFQLAEPRSARTGLLLPEASEATLRPRIPQYTTDPSGVTGTPAEFAVPESVRQSVLGNAPPPQTRGGFESGRLAPRRFLGQLEGQQIAGVEPPQPTGTLGQLAEPRMSPQPPVNRPPIAPTELHQARPTQSRFLDQLSGREAPDVQVTSVARIESKLDAAVRQLEELLGERKLGQIKKPKGKKK